MRPGVHRLTCGLSLPDGIAHAHASCYHVEHGRVIVSGLPVEESHEESDAEHGPGQHEHEPLEVYRHVADEERAACGHRAEADEHRADGVDAQRTRHERLQNKRTRHKRLQNKRTRHERLKNKGTRHERLPKTR